MPHQLGVTIRAPVAAEQVAELRDWLAEIAPKGLAEGPFDFTHLRGLHFAKLYLLDETADLDGQQIPATLVFMSEVDAPLRRHLAELIDLAGEVFIEGKLSIGLDHFHAQGKVLSITRVQGPE